MGLSWKEIVQNYITKYSDQIKRATKPLKDHFGIGYFTYHRINTKGKYTVLVDRPDWAEHYVNQQIFLHDPYLRHPSVYQSGVSILENHGSDEYKETVCKEGKAILDMDTGLMVIHKEKSFVEFFGFSGSRKTSCLQSLYMNRPQVLRSFATHFKETMHPILIQMEDEAGSLIDLKGNDFFCKESICPDIPSTTLVSYYKALGVKSEFEKSKNLSQRERQCLSLLIEDKSAKEIAVALGLSARTVEFYFENIKNKLSCWNKRDLQVTANLFKETGLL